MEEREDFRKQFLKLISEGQVASAAARKLGLPERTARRWADKAKKDAKAVEVANAVLSGDKKPTLQKKRGGSKFAEHHDTDLKSFKRFVITSIQNDTMINTELLASLRVYCKQTNAKLLILPIKYQYNKLTSIFNCDIDDLYYHDVNLSKRLKMMPQLDILPTIVDPHAGLDPISKGDTMIIAHPQTSMKTMPTIGNSPAQMWTTSSISVAKYPRNKTGHKAEQNHTNGALIVELGRGDSFHIRHVNCDSKNGLYDFPLGNVGYYSPEGFTPDDDILDALQPGDSHFTESDPQVLDATFYREDSIAKVLKPKKLLFHDSLSFQNGSHHGKQNHLLQWGKYASGMFSVEAELEETCGYLAKIALAVPGAEMYIVDSNHDNHADQWLATVNPKEDLPNAKFYYFMMYKTMDAMEKSHVGPKFPAFYPLYIKNSKFSNTLKDLKFLNGRASFQIHGIECGQHGHRGANGAKGSLVSFSRFPMKINVGHSHSPGIRLGVYMAGTSSYLDLPYTGGASSWMHTHNLIFKNGKRGQVNIINGQWRGPFV